MSLGWVSRLPTIGRITPSNARVGMPVGCLGHPLFLFLSDWAVHGSIVGRTPVSRVVQPKPVRRRVATTHQSNPHTNAIRGRFVAIALAKQYRNCGGKSNLKTRDVGETKLCLQPKRCRVVIDRGVQSPRLGKWEKCRSSSSPNDRLLKQFRSCRLASTN